MVKNCKSITLIGQRGSKMSKNELKGNTQMNDYIRSLERMTEKDSFYTDELELLDEAGNISSTLAVKKHNDVLKHGRNVLKSRDAREVDKELAKMIASASGLSLMAVAVSGDKSFTSTIAKGASLRGL